IAVSPDGKMIATSELLSDATPVLSAVVRQFGTWKILAKFNTVGPPQDISFSPDNTRLAIGTTTGWLQLWDLRTRHEIDRVSMSEGQIASLLFSPDGTWLAAGCNDRLGRLYDISQSKIRLLNTFRDGYNLSISPDKTRVLVNYFSNFLTLRSY